jgi:hypothetical protein
LRWFGRLGHADTEGIKDPSCLASSSSSSETMQ